MMTWKGNLIVAAPRIRKQSTIFALGIAFYGKWAPFSLWGASELESPHRSGRRILDSHRFWHGPKRQVGQPSELELLVGRFDEHRDADILSERLSATDFATPWLLTFFSEAAGIDGADGSPAQTFPP